VVRQVRQYGHLEIRFTDFSRFCSLRRVGRLALAMPLGASAGT